MDAVRAGLQRETIYLHFATIFVDNTTKFNIQGHHSHLKICLHVYILLLIFQLFITERVATGVCMCVIARDKSEELLHYD